VEDLNIETFTTYAELTEDTVLSWVKGVVITQPSYWEHINTQILKSIRDNKSPVDTIFENDLPWSPTSGSSAVVLEASPAPVVENTTPIV
jgi:hypothetical protein